MTRIRHAIITNHRVAVRVLGAILAALAFIPWTARGVLESDMPVEIFVQTPPTPVRADGATILSYEIHVTNFRALDLTLEHVLVYDLADSVKPLAAYPDDSSIARVWHPGVAPSDTTDPFILHGGRRMVILFWLPLPADQNLPRMLTHRLILSLTDSKGERIVRAVEGGITPVADRDIVPCAWPVRSGDWLEFNGPSVEGEHRRAMHALDGRTFVAQRFAIDLVKLGDSSRLWHTDASRNENWYGYGQDVLAVADGEVAQTHDGVPENSPLSPTRAVRMTRANSCGNYVVLKLREGEFVLYAHLRPGGIMVKAGQRVKKGDILGQIGNSGNSDAPHLHFHAVDGPAPLASEGIPFTFDEFEVLSTVKPQDIDGILSGGRAPVFEGREPEVLCKREIPTGNTLIRVP